MPSFQAKLGQASTVHAVLGNEACDLDSAACAFVYSQFLRQLLGSDELVLPILNIPSSDYALKTEVVYLFEKLGVGKDELVFRDQIDLQTISKTHKLKITLVDQNILRGDDAALEPFVIEVIDHHKRERAEDPKCEVTLEMVGSCAALVAEKILRTKAEVLTAEFAKLLLGAILVDTANLSPAAKRATPKDHEIAAKLAQLLPEEKTQTFFEELQSAKEDITKLSPLDVLRKDVKVVGAHGQDVALSSLPMLVVDFVSMPDSLSSVDSFVRSRNLKAEILLGTKINRENGEIGRDIGIYSNDQIFAQKVTECLTSSEEPPLFLEELPQNDQANSDQQFFQKLKVYLQGNSAASRKIILPLVKNFLDSSSLVQQAQAPNCCTVGVGLASSTQPLTTPSTSERHTSREESPFILTPPTIPTPNGVHPHLIMNGVHLLSVSESLMGSSSHSQGSSSYSSCPYTPQNSSAEGAGPSSSGVNLPSFNSRDMMEKIESKRGQLLGCDFEESHNYPFTPKNSFADSSFDSLYQRLAQMPEIDSDTIVRKLSEKSGRRSPVLEEEELE